MTRLPRDISGQALIKALTTFGYSVTRQTGSHIRLTTSKHGTHNLTIPNHKNIRIGTLSNILKALITHHRISREELIKKLF
ncbi:MAG: hypothetical protein A3F16_03640 [Deltaproteobacteria bacterium RIFCSPHIGHO2_12_FULL_43_9]|nr:MAG: hypothetical protein A3F16_03640 [Deltaproteobacteria bacterium RIFCSPHIGHO2_12_FULL_43_9]